MRKQTSAVNGTIALMLLAATSIATIPVMADVSQPPSAIERFDGMNVTPMPDELADKLRGEYLSAAQIVTYAWANWGVRLTVSTANYIANRWKPGTIAALASILKTYYGCGHCVGGGMGGGGGGTW